MASPAFKIGKVFNCNVLNVRDRPSLEDSNIVATLRKDTEVQVAKSNRREWLKIKMGDDVYYVMSQFIMILA